MIALVVDDLGLAFDSVARVRGALKKFVDEQMQPGDLVAIVRTGAGMGALQQFTADKRVLYAAIDWVRFNPGWLAGPRGREQFRRVGERGTHYAGRGARRNRGGRKSGSDSLCD